MFEQVLPETSQKLFLAINDTIKGFQFYLGGGSGLALQLGHRISEDLDFFCTKNFQPELISHYLEFHFKYQ